MRIEWSLDEAAVLLQAVIDVKKGNVKRKEAVTKVSNILRQLATLKGLDVDDKFRNENGISFQMDSLEYIYIGGKTGLSPNFRKSGDWAEKIVDIYKFNREQFYMLLNSVKEKIS